MSKADEMFNKLGFNKYEFDTSIDYVSRENRQGISLKKDMKVIDSYCGIRSEYITMQQLQAINEKCKELGWLDDK